MHLYGGGFVEDETVDLDKINKSQSHQQYLPRQLVTHQSSRINLYIYVINSINKT